MANGLSRGRTQSTALQISGYATLTAPPLPFSRHFRPATGEFSLVRRERHYRKTSLYHGEAEAGSGAPGSASSSAGTPAASAAPIRWEDRQRLPQAVFGLGGAAGVQLVLEARPADS
jgi:hypothetical protein